MKKKLVLMTSALMAISLLAGCNKHTHEWGEATYTWASDYSTCTALRVCKGDESHKEEETVKSVYQVTTSATCEVDGEGKYTATFKNTAFEAQVKVETIEAKGHNWGTPTYTWSADYSSCTATRVCEKDPNHKESETAYSAYTEIIPATCDVDGSAVYDAAFENEAFEVQTHEITLPATGHSWGTPTYKWADDNSTCTATRVCLNDATHTESETVEATYSVSTEPTCETAGVGRYTTKSFKSTAFTVQTKDVAIPAAGHTWGTPTYTWSNDYSSCTATRVCEKDPNHKESETVNSTSAETQATYVAEGSITYTATFKNAAFSTQTYQQKTSDKLPYHGEVPLLSEDGKTLTYGLYPQKNVNDEELLIALNALPETDGYYFYENAYYAKVSATPFLDNYKFDNGTTIVEGTTYWFKCEPISWTILTNDYVDADEHHLGYYLLSSVLLDAHRYDDDSSNYANSEIRSFLINDFYNSAFTLNNTYIQTTTVDNSASTTNSDDNPYVCDNTKDKVFLPSYKDYINSNYGFLDSEDETETRYCKTTDWARARGGEYSTDECYYWTRSPDDRFDDPKYASYVRWGGELSGNYVPRTYSCVRPAISIKIA